jgi:hypothetical protein
VSTEKEKRIIVLNKENKNSREISKLTRSSFGTISRVLEKARNEEKALAQRKTMMEEETQAGARYTQAMTMFSMGKSPIDVAKKITGMKADEVLAIHVDYMKLNNAKELARIYVKARPYISSLLRLYERTREENIKQDDLVYSIKNFKDLRILTGKIFSSTNQLEGLQTYLAEIQKTVYSLLRQKRELENTIRSYRSKELHYRKRFKSFSEYEAFEEEFDKRRYL